MLSFGHVALSVSDLQKSIGFYKIYFGLCCVEKFTIKSAGLTIAILKKGDICLELFEFKKHKNLPAYRRELDSDLRTIGVKHFSFEVPRIEQFYRKLKRRLVSFATEMRVFEDGRKYFFVKDPDGILVEIMESKVTKSQSHRSNAYGQTSLPVTL
jgi:glyoxylase I family protein